MSLLEKIVKSSVCLLTASALQLYAINAPEPPPFEKPAPSPANVSSSEGLPPLPYPGVPMKRQEKKNPPQPPVLLTKISTRDADDWARTPNDMKNLLSFMSKDMNVHFTSNIKSFNQISKDPEKNPILYRSGYKQFELMESEKQNLRDYILNGGTIIFNTLVGNPDFYKSTIQSAKEIIPERIPYRLRMDHPIFHSFYDINKVEFNERMVKDGISESKGYPFIEGVDIDNRTAIIISRWDLSCGFESNKHENWGYRSTDAKKLGANLVSYITAMKNAGRSVGKSVELVDVNKKNAGKFRVGQVIHNGVWKTRTAAFPMLLNQFNSTTGAPVSFALDEIGLDDEKIFEHPFLYLTGTTDFSLNQNEINNLRRYLQNGGVLFAEASEGRPSFDFSFREEIKKVLPDKNLEKIASNHVLYNEPLKITNVKARPQLAAKQNNKIETSPEIYGININDSLAVIYSRYDLSTGWEKALSPYAEGYESKDSTDLGINILSYSVMH